MLGTLWDYRELWWSGLMTTALLTVVSFAGATVLGTIIAAFRISPIAPLRVVGLIFVEIFRNVPLMSLIILVVYALPEIEILLGYNESIILAMTLVGASFICEALRTGVNGVDRGQIEAARSIGLGFSGVVGQVVLPQAFRSMVQPIVTVFIGILLSSSLAGVVGVVDLTTVSNYINNREALGLVTFGVAAVMYIVIALSAGAVGDRLERKLRVLR
ncbi:MAG: amino acid ABC transporter permease [Microbacteriaceae bacterium]